MVETATFKTNPAEFLRFHSLLTKGKKGYMPFYFPLMREGKDPWEKISWKNNRKTPQEAMHFMSRGYNIGVAAKPEDPLVIIDVDDISQVPEIKPTLQTISRKRIGRHNYFFAKDETAKKNIAADTAGEVRSCWQYVVAPGSFVPCSDEEIKRMPESEKANAGKYSLFKEFPVSEITYDEFPAVYKQADMSRRTIDARVAVKKITPKQKNRKYGKTSALWDLSISDVSGVFDTNGKRVPMPSEIHGSETGKNCSVSQGLLHCWRHEVTHNAFSFLCVAAGLMPCEEAGKPHQGMFFGADATDGETVFQVWKYAKERVIIPKDDPIPKSALLYFADLCGVGKKEKKNNDRELSELEYRITLMMLNKAGVDHGRQ